MARLPRLTPAGIPQHLIQRGNNRQVSFGCDEDLVAYAGWLREYSLEYEVQIHAWVFMANHIHLLATPGKDNSIPRVMQANGRIIIGIRLKFGIHALASGSAPIIAVLHAPLIKNLICVHNFTVSWPCDRCCEVRLVGESRLAVVMTIFSIF